MRYDPGMSECSICGRAAAPRTENKAFPFCSPRCKTIDLGQWVDEKYRVPDDAEEVERSSLGAGNEERTAARMSEEKA